MIMSSIHSKPATLLFFITAVNSFMPATPQQTPNDIINATCNATVTALWPPCPSVGNLYLQPAYWNALISNSTCPGSCMFDDMMACVDPLLVCAASCQSPADQSCKPCLDAIGAPQCLKCLAPSYALNTTAQPPSPADQANREFCYFSDLIVQDTCTPFNISYPDCSDTLETYLESPNLDPKVGSTTCDSKCSIAKMLTCTAPIAQCATPCTTDPEGSICSGCIAAAKATAEIDCCDCLAYAVGNKNTTSGQFICDKCAAVDDAGSYGGKLN
jgi:hypothetical protein